MFFAVHRGIHRIDKNTIQLVQVCCCCVWRRKSIFASDKRNHAHAIGIVKTGCSVLVLWVRSAPLYLTSWKKSIGGTNEFTRIVGKVAATNFFICIPQCMFVLGEEKSKL